LPRYVVEVGLFEALARKLQKDERKTLQGLESVSRALGDPGKFEGTLYSLCAKFSLSYVIRKSASAGLNVFIEPVCLEQECNTISGFRVISPTVIAPATVDSLVEEFLAGYGKCLEIVYKGGVVRPVAPEVEAPPALTD